jgi:phage terminase small subunit
MAKKTSIRQQIFAKEYVIDLNGTRAAIAAGYSEKGADVRASELLGNSRVKRLIDQYVTKRASKLEIKADKVLEELARLGFANMHDYIKVQDSDAYIDFSALTRDQAAAIQEITVEEYTEGKGEDKRNIKRTKFKLHDKRGPLELIGKNLKMFTDKVEHSGEVTYTEVLTSMRAKRGQ